MEYEGNLFNKTLEIGILMRHTSMFFAMSTLVYASDRILSFFKMTLETGRTE